MRDTPMRKIKIILIIVAAIAATAFLALAAYLNPYLFTRAPEQKAWVNQELTDTDFDVIVLGAEPEGVAAAVAAARNGMKTLLLESASAPGGLLTLGKLNYLDMCVGRDGTLLTRGFFEEFYKKVGGSGYDIADAVNFFIDEITSEPLLTFRTGSSLSSPVIDGDSIVGVRMLEQGSIVQYSGKRFIDATTDGDLCAMSGAAYTFGGEDTGEKDSKMGVTLIFELSGVNWTGVFLHLNSQRLAGKVTGNQAMLGATNKIAWGYEEGGILYNPMDPMVRLRGLNIARQRQGAVLINALVVFDTDPLDPESYREAISRAEAELKYLVPYFRENYAGFKKAELKSTADRLYVRESRHIIGEYRLTIDDVLENRDQWDRIAIGSYPADVQPSMTQRSGTVIGNPDRYSIPFRCLIPLYVDNLLIAGRSASFTSLAASSARVVPLGMACGQAAGTAAAQSIREYTGFRQMSSDAGAISRLQSTLVSQGAYLEDFNIEEPIMSHWAYSGMAALRRLGLIGGGYNNDYRLDEPITKSHFMYLLNGVVRKTGNDTGDFWFDGSLNNGTAISVAANVILAVEGAGNDGSPPWDGQVRSHLDNLEILSGAGVIDGGLKGYYQNSEGIPQTAQAVMLLSNLYDWLME